MPEAITRADVVAAVARLDLVDVAAQRWFGAKGRSIVGIGADQAFVLDESPPHALAIVTAVLEAGGSERYTLALTGEPLREAVPGDGAWRALATAMHEGRVIPAIAAGDDAAAPTAVLVCRPGPAMPPGGPGAERPLGADQSHTSVVLGEQVLLKAFRRLQPGLNPDLEMTAFLSEQAGFTAVPPIAGYAELVDARHGATTVAMAQTFVADAADAYETVAEGLTAWMLAPGEVSVEYATEVAADIGTLTAGLHAAVADGHGLPEMAPRPASRAEIRDWASTAHAALERALEVTPGDAGETLRRLAPAITEALTVLDGIPTAPEVIRAHGDYHLGQVLMAADGYRIIDFEGDPLYAIDERRAHRSPMRDLASMLRSFDHVGRSARRRARERSGAPLERPGLDLDAWLVRSRERFLEAYRAGLLERRVVPDIDEDLLRAFEVESECREFTYAATWIPSWLWAPTESMQALIERRGP
jgi:maltose alpha-D-glucosyltransferase/alpha-amylase